MKSTKASFAFKEIARDSSTVNIETAKKDRFKQILRRFSKDINEST